MEGNGEAYGSSWRVFATRHPDIETALLVSVEVIYSLVDDKRDASMSHGNWETRRRNEVRTEMISSNVSDLMMPTN